MKTGTGLLLVLASATGAAVGVALSRKQKPSTRALAVGAGFLVPWGLHAAFGPVPATVETGCTVLFITDTHGSAEANAALVQAMLAETNVDHVIHAGDVADNASLYPLWWDRPFRAIQDRWPVDVVSGNHDHEDEATYAEFVARFGAEPRTALCGNAEFFLVPWGVAGATARWLLARVQASPAKWKVLVTHKPLWGVDGSGREMRTMLADSLSYIDLVLAGHQHVSWDSTHNVDGHLIRQIIDVSGPKKYDCPADVRGCIQDETAYWRIEFGPDEIKAARRVVG